MSQNRNMSLKRVTRRFRPLGAKARVKTRKMRGGRHVGSSSAGDEAPARRALTHSREEDRVVYQDLAEPADARSLLFSPEAQRRPVAAPTSNTVSGLDGEHNGVLARPKGIFEQKPLFHLDGSGDEGEREEGDASEDENPFASLLRAAALSDAPASSSIDELEDCSSAEISVKTRARSTGSAGGKNRLANQKQALRLNASSFPPRERAGDHRVAAKPQQRPPKRLSFESADSRPARWGTRPSKPSVKDTENRRRSLNAIHQRRLQKSEASETRRRSAFSVLQGARRSLDSDRGESQGSSVAKKPRLSEVLRRATILSQPTADESPTEQLQSRSTGSPVESDVILDTEQQMKAEPFSPPVFSPSRPSERANRKQKRGDAVLSKLRGDIGEAVRKAVRRTNRDLTLLRSDGQSLLAPQGDGSTAGVERIQERDHVVVCLRDSGLPAHGIFDCIVHSATPDVEQGCPDRSERVQVMLAPQTVEAVKAAPGVVLRIYAPFHFVPRRAPVGLVDGSMYWFLIGTQLAEVVEREHACSP